MSRDKERTKIESEETSCNRAGTMSSPVRTGRDSMSKCTSNDIAEA